MALTVAGLDALLNRAVGPYAQLARVGDAAAWATRQMGYAAAAADGVTDAELAALPVADLNQFLDLARLQIYQTIRDNLDPPLMKEAGVDRDPDKEWAKYARLVSELKQSLADQYGYGRGTVSLGSVDLGFAAYDGTTYG